MEIGNNITVHQNGLTYTKYLSGTIDLISDRAVKIKVFGTNGFIWLPKAALKQDSNLSELYKIMHWFKFDEKTQFFFDRYSSVYSK